MTPKQFIEKAIEGGWETPGGWSKFQIIIAGAGFYDEGENYVKNTSGGTTVSLEEIFLDPLAWQAVGKVEGWYFAKDTDLLEVNDWKNNMHRMIDALCEGKSIEQFLENL